MRSDLTEEEVLIEWEKCRLSCSYFINTYCKIYDATDGTWLKFKLWPAQERALKIILTNNLICVLKARQIGLTWLSLAYLLWIMIFSPIATVLMFSRRDDDAIYLLSNERLRGMYEHLPKWLQVDGISSSSSHQWTLSNRSNARAFPTTGGDSYTATAVLVDEADLIPDLNRLLRSTKPTIDAGGKLILISRSDKSQPESEFKNIYRSAVSNENGWGHIFLPWNVRPGRNEEWYQRQKAEIFSRTGSLDDLYEQYPATPDEALMPRSLDKRIHPDWLLMCYEPGVSRLASGPGIPGLIMYEEPNIRHKYFIGADPAEGNPLSDDSAITVFNATTGEESAHLSNKYEPAIFGSHIRTLSNYFNSCPVLVERNNHGHAVILWLTDNTMINLMLGLDDKIGWLTSSKSKALLYDSLADGAKNREFIIHTEKVYNQVGSIEGSTLRAPETMMDDSAIAFALARYAAKSGIREIIMRTAGVKW